MTTTIRKKKRAGGTDCQQKERLYKERILTGPKLRTTFLYFWTLDHHHGIRPPFLSQKKSTKNRRSKSNKRARKEKVSEKGPIGHGR